MSSFALNHSTALLLCVVESNKARLMLNWLTSIVIQKLLSVIDKYLEFSLDIIFFNSLGIKWFRLNYIFEHWHKQKESKSEYEELVQFNFIYIAPKQ